MVAVVHAGDGRIAIWHVDVGRDSGLARMAGAWVLPASAAGDDPAASDSVDNNAVDNAVALLRGRRILSTPAGRAVVGTLMGDAKEDVDGFVDIEATLAGISDVIDGLQTAFETEVAGRKAKLVDPAWPELPAALDVAAASGDDLVVVALEMARWLEGLVKTWDKVEGQRLTRKFLTAHGGSDRRSLPVRI